MVKFTQSAVIQWLEDVMCVFTFPTQKMLSEAKIENVPFVSIKQTVGDEYRGSLPYAHFGTWKKPCYMKFVLVDCTVSPTNTNSPTYTYTSQKSW